MLHIYIYIYIYIYDLSRLRVKVNHENSVYCFSRNDYILPTNRWPVMAYPSSSTIPEISLQYTELNYIVHLAIKHKLLGYFRHVDDIMIIYDQYATKINLVYRSSTFQSMSKHL